MKPQNIRSKLNRLMVGNLEKKHVFNLLKKRAEDSPGHRASIGFEVAGETMETNHQVVIVTRVNPQAV